MAPSTDELSAQAPLVAASPSGQCAGGDHKVEIREP